MPDLALLQKRLAAEGLTAVVLTSHETVSPFARTNIVTQVSVPKRLACFVIPAQGSTTLVVCNIEEAEVRVTTSAEEVRSYVEFAENPVLVLADVLRDVAFDGATVGLELDRLPGPVVEALRRALPSIDFVGADDLLSAAVSVKTPDEVDALATNGIAAQRAVDLAIANVKAGVTERDASKALMWELVQTGGRPEFVVFGSGAHTTQGHPVPDGTQLRDGVLWRVDLGARYPDGTLSDLARTGVVGKASTGQEEAMAIVVAAQRAAVEAIEPGRPARELWMAAAKVVESGGLRIWAPHIGHGLGVGIHEHPALSPSNDSALTVGTVLNIEPMVVIPERQEGYHTEDLVLVTDTGYRRLTEPQAELLRIAG